MFNWGIIGLGKIAHKFVEDLQKVPDARLYAVASRDLERSQDFSLLYNAEKPFGSYEEIVTCQELDAVYIATPHTGHFENSIMCLEHNIPVLCEKPLGMNAEQVHKMVSLARFQETFLMEAMWTRFLPTIKKVLELIDSGIIGEVRTLKADFGFAAERDPRSRVFNQGLGGGSLLDVGIYPVFLSLLLFGRPKSIRAAASIGPTNVDEDCAMILKFQGQKLAMLHSSIITNTKTEAVIYGEKGHIHIHPRWHELSSVSYELNNGQSERFDFEYHCRGFSYEIQEAMDCIKGGRFQSDKMSHDFSLMLMKVLDDIRLQANIFYPLSDHFTDKEIATKANKFSQN
ncbi:MAG: Gfo/Idh/MocA family oxidoreductase [Saprospiraceae bacterium]|nr:Gfo/Idh/MocA family oxidoreductase [Saprospiraceae bacterium]